MSIHAPALFSLKSRIPGLGDTLYLLEPSGSSAEDLWARLLSGSYNKPFIADNGTQRYLQFDLYSAQSAMNLERPDWLCLEYTRSMMAFLLFNPTPQRILLLGLGGGSLVKFCRRHLPQADITAIEVNPWVIALREEFCIPKDDGHFRVVSMEGSEYLALQARSKDIILVDACDGDGVAPSCSTIEFYQSADRRLSAQGVLVVNICGYGMESGTHLERIRQVFGDDYLFLQVRGEGNVIVFAFKDRGMLGEWSQLRQRAARLEPELGLAFSKYARRFALGWHLRHW